MNKCQRYKIPGVCTPKLERRYRECINEDLRAAGLDGNWRFRSPGYALNEIAGVLANYGIEWDEVLSAWRFRGDSGHTLIHLACSNPDDPFSPTPVENTALSFQWYKHGPDRYEALAYLG
jgi:hypothetical protein